MHCECLGLSAQSNIVKMSKSVTRKFSWKKKKNNNSDFAKEKICYIAQSNIEDECDDYNDIVSVSIILKLWHIVDQIFKSLDAVSLLHCEKVNGIVNV